MRIKKFRYFVGDFETTVFDGQEYTEVWASASVELFSDDVKIFGSIEEQFEYFLSLKTNICVYYHNLKFDGNFWLYYLLKVLKYEQAYENISDSEVVWLEEKHMKNKSFKYSISDMGQWYSIIIKVNNIFIEIRDSLKLLPFSVERIGKSFNTKHKKLNMEYKGVRYAGCIITENEKEYIANDVLVVKEALEIMFTEGHNKLTIGSCCLDEFKKIIGKDDYQIFFPSLTDMKLDESIHRYGDVDTWIRKSYKGGWCYLVKGKENKIFNNGTTADVNSLYPSMMSSESGNRYPVGQPKFWNGDYIPDDAIAKNKYYFVRIKTRFKLKKGYLPFIQIKNSHLYKGTQMLESSDVYDKKTNKYYDKYYDENGVLHDTFVELTLTMTDYELFLEHYETIGCEIIDGCYFYTSTGIFDPYIEKYKKKKLESKDALRELAKLFLNNLYGKLASSSDSSFKVAFLKDDDTIGFYSVPENNKQPVFIAIGSAITSYARNFTIRTAQANYHGVNKKGFIYADTDSIHCDLSPNELKGVKVHEKDFCCWKLESCWDSAIFVRQKTYIEHITKENLLECQPYYNIKCAGMPQKCKNILTISLEGGLSELENKMNEGQKEYVNKLNEKEKEFANIKRKLTDFKIGLKIHGKLTPKRIKGGVLLVDTTYEMK